jgi:hypothetical protein
MSPKIVSNKHYVAGWLDSSLHDFLGVLPSGEPSCRYALITCLDSNPNPVSLRAKSPELKFLASDLQPFGSGLLVSTKALLKSISKQQLFFGFDELWFFPQRPVMTKPSNISVVGPSRIMRSEFPRISKWMLKNSCSMALGGGVGLNFVASDQAHRILKLLLGYSIEQPESSLVIN